MRGYKGILISKNTEEILVSKCTIKPSSFHCSESISYAMWHQLVQANFARWEPCHGRFRFLHPWKHYLKIGSLARRCAYQLEALNGYLSSDIQVRISSTSIIMPDIAFQYLLISAWSQNSLHYLCLNHAGSTNIQEENRRVMHQDKFRIKQGSK